MFNSQRLTKWPYLKSLICYLYSFALTTWKTITNYTSQCSKWIILSLDGKTVEISSGVSREDKYNWIFKSTFPLGTGIVLSKLCN